MSEHSDLDKTYYIPPDYRPNPRPHYSDSVPYWTADRIRHAYYYQAPVYRYAHHMIRKLKARSLMDVGCGVGVKLEAINRRFPHVTIVGLDLREGIDYCRTHHAFGVWREIDLEAPALEEPIRSDVVLCADVIEHLDNPDALLTFFRSALNPDGHIILSTPERIALRGAANRSSPNPAHIREWSFSELPDYLASRGFAVVSHFRTWPVGMGLHGLAMEEIGKRWLHGKSARTNQVCLLRRS